MGNLKYFNMTYIFYTEKYLNYKFNEKKINLLEKCSSYINKKKKMKYSN